MKKKDPQINRCGVYWWITVGDALGPLNLNKPHEMEVFSRIFLIYQVISFLASRTLLITLAMALKERKKIQYATDNA